MEEDTASVGLLKEIQERPEGFVEWMMQVRRAKRVLRPRRRIRESDERRKLFD